MIEERAIGEPVWRVRVFLRGGGAIHCLSRTKPKLSPSGWSWEPVNDTPYGDTVGEINWDEVSVFSFWVESELRWYYGAVRPYAEAAELYRAKPVERRPDGSTVRLDEQPQS